MQIHVVRPGQSIYGIAQAYNTTPQLIAQANELPDPNRLVIGQALVIPIEGRYYFVQPGDTLWEIGRKFNISYQKLATVNNISVTQRLTPGTRLYIPPSPKRNAEFYGYVEASARTITPSVENLIRKNAKYLTYLGAANFEVRRDGSLKEPNLNNLQQISDQNNVSFSMVVTNIENGAFSDELGRIILNEPIIENNLLNNIISTAKRNNFTEIAFDFEYLRPEDQEAYLNFLRRAKARLKQEGYFMSVALAPKTSRGQKGRWYEAHDYRGIGEIADFVVIMTYEWGYSGGPPMAVSPIGPVRKVLEYAVTEIPSTKIMMGQNLYGYDWTLPYVPGGQYAKALSPQRSIELAYRYNVPIEYDSKAQAPHFNYRDENGKEHVVWFEDARSIQAKFNLLKELNLRGMAYWKLGLPFPQNWLLIQDNFNVIKKR
ncbi:LysM peptidoglycan-binding domain-containing protein [Bacillus songklensis]|uniref:LysM peptidoglycan-binding domain-containing protein n=1 Tax=Bacillus songklensis TaxID=1069116 RepID=A0ABV8B2E6_9BACI